MTILKWICRSSLPGWFKIKGKIKVKGNGQECPFHTGGASLRGRPRRPSLRELRRCRRTAGSSLAFGVLGMTKG
jgi:hypothetical protein